MMNTQTLLFVVAVWFCNVLCDITDIPVTNPIAIKYNNDSKYEWTNKMVNWSCVVNAKVCCDGDWNKTQDMVKQQCNDSGGGVAYFPSGTYKFTENIYIDGNIVIRGDVDNGDAKSGTNPGNLNPSTIFQCPDLKHMGFINANNKSNIGIININMIGCAIMLWPSFIPSQLSFYNYFDNIKTIVGSGTNKLIFGNKLQQISLGNPNPTGDTFNYTMNETSPWPWRFGCAISVYSQNNSLIANNLIAKTTKSFKTNVCGYNNIDYHYDNRYGIDLNAFKYASEMSKTSGGPCLATPQNSPFYFPINGVVRDNYVFQNGRVGISWSGWDGIDAGKQGKAGYGTIIYNNHVEVANNTYCYSVTGDKCATGHDTNENRGYNQGGYGSNVTMNSGHIYRQKVPPNGNYETVDGEGILHQCSSNCDGYRNLWMNNDLRDGESGYMMYYNLYHTDYNVLENNKVNSDQEIGARYDSNHNEHHGNVCSNNSPSCTGIPP